MALRQIERLNTARTLTLNPNSTLQVNLSALSANVAAIRAALPDGAAICAIVKANAYGLGVLPVAKRLSAEGVELLAVYAADEARRIAEAGVPTPVVILQPVDHLDRTDVLYRSAVAGRLELALHSRAQLDAIEQIGRTFGAAIPAHLVLDTGMSREGMDEAEAGEVLEALPRMRYVKLVGLYTHPLGADDNAVVTERQYRALARFAGAHQTQIADGVRLHFANTCAMLRSEQYHLSMVRLGLSIYGYGDEKVADAVISSLSPTVSWVSRIVHVRRVPSGTTVGYHGAFTTWRDSRLGIVPVGYADGYPLSLSNRGVVRVGEDLTPAEVRGEVNMDQLIVDLTDSPDAGFGSFVEIYSDDPAAPNAVPAMAAAARSSVYELLCRIGAHVPRQYLTRGGGRGVFPRLAGP